MSRKSEGGPVAVTAAPRRCCHQGQRPEELILGGDHHRYLAFRYLACALPELPWQDWRDSDNIVARLNLPNMLHGGLRT
jgi:hypothetical protein